MKIKNILLVIVLVFSSIPMFANNDFIDTISDIDGVTSVYISKAMLGKMKGKKPAGTDIGSIASKLNSMTILTSDSKKAVVLMRKKVKLILNNAKQNGFEQLMKIKDDDSKVDMYMKSKGSISTLLMVIDEGDEFRMIVLDGQISIDDIQKLTN